MGNFISGLLTDPTWKPNEDVTDFTKATTLIQDIANAVLSILGVAVVGVAIFIAFKFFTADDEEKRKNAKGQLIYAIIGVVAVVIVIVAWNTIIAPLISGEVVTDATE